ncbi:MAG TPA: Stk1 family PASTA domain-containing Ser/Thr kinase [Anaerolineae bacterium]|nr:Stk1 family PASTA domain-containing Ser/Thr kinase [Anaerolineae bacterium]
MSEHVFNNRYRVLAQIAGGGMAVIYKAHDTVLNRVVAVKVLRDTFAQDADFRARFQHEAQAAANLGHPNIVTVYDYGQDGAQSYIVMEYVEGRDLKTVIRSEAPLLIDRALDLMIQACAALGAAHRAGLVHCDVKPQNVLVTNDGRVKVTDFGIARAMSASVPQNVETVWGTPHYFSPEQAAGEPPTPASDVYSLGVVLYEMLAGRVPFDADNHTDLALQHLRDEPPPLTAFNPAVPIQIEQIINKAMSKEPANRYRTADLFGRALLDYRRMTNQATGYQRPIVVPTSSGSTTVAAATARPQEAVPIQGGTDWLGWILGTLAFIAVVGLIPLFVLVWRAYSQPAAPTPIPSSPNSIVTPANSTTITPSFGNEVLVPNLIGRTQADAEKLASSNGLQITIGAGRFDPKAPQGNVVAQNPMVGKKVAKGATIEINLSEGPKVSPVVNLLNVIYEDAAEGLKAYGWDVRLVEQYSQDTYHKILAQEPAPGVQLAAGEPLTLTVSGGTTVTLGVNLADLISLDAANLPLDQVKPGEALDVSLLWRAQQRINTPYTVFLHFVGPSGNIVTQIDREPILPTTSWPISVTIDDPYALTIPANAATGTYQLLVGLYPTGDPSNRLAVVDAGNTTADNNNRILIKNIVVQP